MLRPTFLGFESAKRGLSASQKGLDITGQNLTNWDSDGYTRQRIDQVAVAAGSYNARYGSNRIGVAGQGVDISGIAQVRDNFLDKRFREECGDVGYHTAANGILLDIQSALNEYQTQNDVGLRAGILSMQKALQAFSGNAYSETHANIVATEFKNMAQTLQLYNNNLNDVAEQQKYDLDIAVNDVNKMLTQVAELNKTISREMSIMRDDGTYGPNELLDQRNLILDQLSQYADLNIQNDADGSVTVKMNGMTVVNGGKAEKMQLRRDDDRGTVAIHWVSSGDKVDLTTGSLKASTDFINGRGPNRRSDAESTERGVLYYRDKIDTFAQKLVDVVNNIVPDGKDANGNTTYKTLMGAMVEKNGAYVTDPDATVTAGNISISDAWAKDPSYVIFEDKSSNNNYALALSNAISTESQMFDSNGEKFEGNFLDYVKGYAATLGEDVSFHENRQNATASIADELNEARDGVSGVVVDEEVANVMLYQKSLQAASRLMTTMDEALDVLINKTGLVGR